MLKKVMKIVAVVISSSLILTACASEEKSQPKLHPALVSSQDYFVDNGMPVREVKEQQKFFFKKCEVDNTGPWPTKTTYDCNEP